MHGGHHLKHAASLVERIKIRVVGDEKREKMSRPMMEEAKKIRKMLNHKSLSVVFSA